MGKENSSFLTLIQLMNPLVNGDSGTAKVSNLPCYPDMDGVVSVNAVIFSNCDNVPQSILLNRHYNYASNGVLFTATDIYSSDGSYTATNDIGTSMTGTWSLNLTNNELTTTRQGDSWALKESVPTTEITTFQGCTMINSYYYTNDDGQSVLYSQNKTPLLV